MSLPSAGRKFFLLGLKTLHSFWSRATSKYYWLCFFSEFGVAQVSPIQHRSPLVLLARDARASACARLRFLPWQPGWEIRVSGSDVLPYPAWGSATVRLRFFRLACVADQISRSAARIVFATLRVLRDTVGAIRPFRRHAERVFPGRVNPPYSGCQCFLWVFSP